MTRGFTLGYCTNVHPGATLTEVCENLRRHAAAVKRRYCPDEPLAVGLWLPRAAIASAAFADLELLRNTLADNGLFAFTLNGFPYGDFHGPVVQHAVYRPDWSDPARLDYTIELALRLAALTAGAESSISTLPIGWKADFRSPARLEAAAHALRRLAVRLHELQALGSFVHVDLEPEPGCVLESSRDVVAFFERYLLCEKEAEFIRRHLGVCHDVCHAAVMFEDQAEALGRYAAAGIRVGKVQISSALQVPPNEDDAARRAALAALAAFDEPRYLHQTVIRRAAGDIACFESVGAALAAAAADARLAQGEWRCHFHVPIHHADLGSLRTTQVDIAPALRAARRHGVRHYEVETYAWDVLPPEFQTGGLEEGLARELHYARDVLTTVE